MIEDKRAFVLLETALAPVPHAPSIRLRVAHEAMSLWQRTEEDLGALGLPPPFWAFAWAGGQALARHLLDTPELVAGRSVLDFASGSGLVGIAAAKAGAARVLCADIDPYAIEAIALNAEANGVAVESTMDDLIGSDAGWDVVLAGDIFYQRDIAERLEPWLRRLAGRGALVLIGDPGRAYLPKDGLVEIARYSVPVTRELEDADLKRACVWRFA